MAKLIVEDVQIASSAMVAAYLDEDELSSEFDKPQWNGWTPQLIPNAGTLRFEAQVGLIQELYTSDAGAFVARNTEQNSLIVAFQGSQPPLTNLDDWISNAGGGFYNWDPLYATFDPFVQFVRSLVDQHGIDKIIVTGHSQGAAMAEAFMHEHREDTRYVGVVFASPGTRHDFDDIAAERMLKIEHTDDLVVDLADKVGAEEVGRIAFLTTLLGPRVRTH